jgi:hypothetical protein
VRVVSFSLVRFFWTSKRIALAIMNAIEKNKTSELNE